MKKGERENALKVEVEVRIDSVREEDEKMRRTEDCEERMVVDEQGVDEGKGRN